MELQQFVSLTLQQIAGGVRDAQEELRKAGSTAKINPGLQRRGRVWPIQPVEFDVAVTAEEGTEKKSGIGVMVASVGLGKQDKRDTSRQSVSRVKFSVRIFLPTDQSPTPEK